MWALAHSLLSMYPLCVYFPCFDFVFLLFWSIAWVRTHAANMCASMLRRHDLLRLISLHFPFLITEAEKWWEEVKWTYNRNYEMESRDTIHIHTDPHRAVIFIAAEPQYFFVIRSSDIEFSLIIFFFFFLLFRRAHVAFRSSAAITFIRIQWFLRARILREEQRERKKCMLCKHVMMKCWFYDSWLLLSDFVLFPFKWNSNRNCCFFDGFNHFTRNWIEKHWSWQCAEWGRYCRFIAITKDRNM